MSRDGKEIMTVAETYIDVVNRADLDSLTGMLAPDAVLKHPTGIYSGIDEISRFYTTVVFAGKAVTEIERVFVIDGSEILQLRASSPLGEPGNYVYAVDVFTLRDGLIAELAIYYR